MTDASAKIIEQAREGRASRHDTSREAGKRESVGDARGLTKAQLTAKFRTEMYSNALPSTPDIPGFHVCWLSTTNKYDSISHRESMGYERVKPEDCPGFEHVTATQGLFAGCVCHEEMVLFKLPLDLWQEYMRIAHHERPYDEEERIRDIARYLKDTTREGGSDVYLGSGTQELINSRNDREPTFQE